MRCIAAALLMTTVCQASFAQGIIVDRHRPIRSYELRELTIDARIKDQAAEVQVSQTFYNPSRSTIEAQYLFPLPEDATIQNMVLLVNGKEMPGRLLPKAEARQIYESIVRQKRDPALLEYVGRGLFRTSVFPIAPGKSNKVTLRYTQLCRRDSKLIEFSYPLSTQRYSTKKAQVVDLNVHIESTSNIKTIYSPSHDVHIDRSDNRHAKLKLHEHGHGSADFKLLYSVSDGAVGGTLLSYKDKDSEDGYFVLLASPDVQPANDKPIAKTVIFALDRSGSMSGKKIEQAKGALRFVLDNLNPNDTFNIIVYDDRVEQFKPELLRYSDETRAEAIRFVDNVFAGGGTNINDALSSSLDQIQDSERPSYVLFLTDGKPTVGERRETAIAAECKESNKHGTRLFVFGVGHDVNSRLLDRLSGGNGGTTEYVNPNEDIESNVARFYSKMSMPALTNITVAIDGTDINRTYPRDVPDLFSGGQLVWVGRYRAPGPVKVTMKGRVGRDIQSFTFNQNLAAVGSNQHEFAAGLWATRRIGFLIDQIDLHGQNKELTKELVGLSKQFGILTPYTSFLADENESIFATRGLYGRATQELMRLGKVSGGEGASQRDFKQSLLRASKSAPATRGGRISGGSSFGGGLGGGGGLSTSTRRYRGKGLEKKAEDKKEVLRRIGTKTFYKKKDGWLDSDIDEQKAKNAEVIEQFSEKYFALVGQLKRGQTRFLAFSESVTLELNGKTYKIVPPAAKK